MNTGLELLVSLCGVDVLKYLSCSDVVTATLEVFSKENKYISLRLFPKLFLSCFVKQVCHKHFRLLLLSFHLDQNRLYYFHKAKMSAGIK